MSVYVPPGQSSYRGPTGKVDFGWIGESWNIFSRSWGVWVGATVIYGAIMIAAIIPLEFAMIGNMQATGARAAAAPFGTFPGTGAFPPNFPWTWMIFFYVVMFALSLFMMSSFMRMALKAVRQLPLSLSDGFSGAPVMGQMFLLGLILGVISIVGSIVPPMALAGGHPALAITAYVLLFLGWLILYPLLMVSPALVADGQSAWRAITQSVSAMKSSFFPALLLIIVFFVMMLVSAVVTCDLGLLVTMPLFYIGIALAYRDMVGMDGIIEPAYGYPPVYSPQPPQPGVWPPAPGQQQPPFGNPYGQQPQPPYGQQPYGQQPQPPAGPHTPSDVPHHPPTDTSGDDNRAI